MKLRWLWKFCPCRSCWATRELLRIKAKHEKEFAGYERLERGPEFHPLYFRDLRTGEPRDTNPNPAYFAAQKRRRQRLEELKLDKEIRDLELERMRKSPMLFVNDCDSNKIEMEPGKVFRTHLPGGVGVFPSYPGQPEWLKP